VVVLVANGLAKGGLYAAAGALERGFDATTVDGYAGRAAAAPATALAVAVTVASLVGLPPSAGFAGKWLVVRAAVESGAPLAAAVVLVSTLLTLGYAGRVVERLYLAPAGDGPAAGQATTPATDGGRSRPRGRPPSSVRSRSLSLPRRAAAVALAAAAATVLLGLGSSALADWIAPVVEGWL
jgi:multicomponent Na+:H+ antiporter subunit D